MNYMKSNIIFAVLLVMSIFIITDVNADDSNIKPEDQPNFHPKISTEIVDGKSVQIIEFNCKLTK